jgi:hypothetical protein
MHMSNRMIQLNCCRALAATLFFLFGVSGDAWAQGAFYRASDQELVGAPGTIIRQEPMMFAPAGAAAYRVLYRSTGLHDEPIAVSGIIVVPPGPAPEGGRPIVAWAGIRMQRSKNGDLFCRLLPRRTAVAPQLKADPRIGIGAKHLARLDDRAVPVH